MNLDNNDDYFLTDFNETPQQPANQADAPVQAGNTVDFSGAAPAPAAPAAKEEKRRRSGCRRFWAWFWSIVIVALGVTVAVRYFVPYVTDSQVRGYVVSVEKRGILCKTFEGELISQSSLADSTRVYQRELTFSIPSDSLARVLQTYQGTARPVTITIERYYGTLPWRGASSTIAVAVDE